MQGKGHMLCYEVMEYLGEDLDLSKQFMIPAPADIDRSLAPHDPDKLAPPEKDVRNPCRCAMRVWLNCFP